MPDRDTRRAAALIADSQLSAKEADRYAEITAGLKAIQIISILTPPPASEEESRQREDFIKSILTGPDITDRAKSLGRAKAHASGSND